MRCRVAGSCIGGSAIMVPTTAIVTAHLSVYGTTDLQLIPLGSTGASRLRPSIDYGATRDLHTLAGRCSSDDAGNLCGAMSEDVSVDGAVQ